jgi:phage N-6-adenine-methyltransferase
MGMKAMSSVGATPPELMEYINEQWGPFDLDVCASEDNAKAPRCFTEAEDGLAREWFGRCYMNPPHGGGLADWVAKAMEEAARGRAVYVVALLPVRMDKEWYNSVLHASEVVFLEGGIVFEGAEDAERYPFAVVVWRRGRKS